MIQLEPGDEVVAMSPTFFNPPGCLAGWLVITRQGRVYELRYTGTGEYKVLRL